MKKIAEIVAQIDDELCGAKEYAESYLDLKANGETQWASKYKDMAQTELNHADTLHERAVVLIRKFASAFPTTPAEMEERWDKAHKQYVEKAAWVKQMLTM